MKYTLTKIQDLTFSQISNLPFVSFGDTITASGEGSYQLPCRLFGKIAFKNIKVKPTEADTILVSGSTVGIYMETDGVLVIDTGETFLKWADAGSGKKYFKAWRLYCCTK